MRSDNVQAVCVFTGEKTGVITFSCGSFPLAGVSLSVLLVFPSGFFVLDSALLGRVVIMLNRHGVGVAPPRRATHKLDGVRVAVTSNACSPQLMPSVEGK